VYQPPFSPAGFPLELHYNLFQNLVQRTVVITLKASNLLVTITVATYSLHSTGIGSGQKQFILKLILYILHISLPNRSIKLSVFKDEDKSKDIPVLNFKTLLYFILGSEITE
jgi:hypothetical protein